MFFLLNPDQLLVQYFMNISVSLGTPVPKLFE